MAVKQGKTEAERAASPVERKKAAAAIIKGERKKG